MRRLGRIALQLLALLLAAVPLTFVITFLTIPLWRWLEETTGIESIGHSGPADWCFMAVFVLILAIGAAIIVRLARKNR